MLRLCRWRSGFRYKPRSGFAVQALIQEQFTDWSDVYGFNMTPMAQKAMESRLGELKTMNTMEVVKWNLIVNIFYR